MRNLLLSVALLCFVATPAWADWSDNFDSYNLGSINGQGGWTGWDNTPASAGIVTNVRSLSAPNSQEITGPADSVHEYSGYTSGSWTYSAMQYIPSTMTGQTMFIMLNKYVVGNHLYGHWSIETHFDRPTSLVTDVYTSQTTPIVYDQWVPIRVEINLDTDQREFFYNNVSLGRRAWTVDSNSILNIACVDLFANNATSVYYDDLSLTPEPAAFGLFALGLLLRRR